MPLRTVLILTVTALSLGAQGRLRLERPRREGAERPAGPLRNRIMERLHEIRARKLQDTLGLTGEKANAIADRWSLFDEESFSRRQQMIQLRQQMNATLMGPGSEEDKNRKLQPVVDQLAGLRQQQEASRKRFEEDIRGSLTPAQQGRFILLMDEFQKSLQEAIQERRKDK
jgi:hypothetical protein